MSGSDFLARAMAQRAISTGANAVQRPDLALPTGALLVGIADGRPMQSFVNDVQGREAWLDGLIFDDSSDAAATANSNLIDARFNWLVSTYPSVSSSLRAAAGRVFIKRTIEIPHNCKLDAPGLRLLAAPTFTDINRGSTGSKFMVVLGLAARGNTVAFACTANCMIDANNVAGLGGVWSNMIQEKSGLLNSTVWKWTTFGIVFEAIGGLSPQNWRLDNLLVTPSDTVSGKQYVRLSGTGCQGIIDKISCTTGATGQAQDAGIVITAARASISGLHAENCTDGARFQAAGGGVIKFSEGFDGGGAGAGLVTNVVKIAADAGGVIVECCRKFGATNLIADLKNAVTYSTDIARYNTDVTAFSGDVHLGGAQKLYLAGPGGPFLSSGNGTPEAAVTAPVGSMYIRRNGGAATCLYIKETGTGNTGWVAK